jgi:hypothetical protein
MRFGKPPRLDPVNRKEKRLPRLRAAPFNPLNRRGAGLLFSCLVDSGRFRGAGALGLVPPRSPEPAAEYTGGKEDVKGETAKYFTLDVQSIY